LRAHEPQLKTGDADGELHLLGVTRHLPDAEDAFVAAKIDPGKPRDVIDAHTGADVGLLRRN